MLWLEVAYVRVWPWFQKGGKFPRACRGHRANVVNFFLLPLKFYVRMRKGAWFSPGGSIKVFQVFPW